MAPPTVYIGCGAGFSGDRLDAAIPVVNTLTKKKVQNISFSKL